MKRRASTYIAGACVAGLVAGAPLTAFANGEGWNAPENMNVDLYGPPAVFDQPVEVLYGPPPISEDPSPVVEEPSLVIDEPIQLLYGPPSVFAEKDNPMKVTAADQRVKSARLTDKAKAFKKAIVVRKAKGAVSFKKVKKTSSDELSVNRKTGVVSIAKGAAKGKYSIKVRVTAAGNAKYRPAVKVVTVTVRVK